MQQVKQTMPEKEDAMDLSYSLVDGAMQQVLQVMPEKDDAMDLSYSLVYGDMQLRKVTALMPDEGLKFAMTCTGGFMDPV